MFYLKNGFFGTIVVIALSISLFTGAAAQKAAKNAPKGKAVLWETVNVARQDLFHGPGGREMAPNIDTITFIKAEKGGYNKKYRIKDASGRIWVAKPGREAQSETAAVRLLAALGYKTEINYLAPQLTIPGIGTFENVRLEARSENIKRLDRWTWDENPFSGTDELQGLKIMMALFNNWDLKTGNNIILQNGDEHYYVISDLGATFGKVGGNSLPIVWRLGRSINRPESYSKSDFIKRIEDGNIEFTFRGKSDKIFDRISRSSGRWLSKLLIQLSDAQIEDAFRAANHSAADIATYTSAVKNRIRELENAVGDKKLASR